MENSTTSGMNKLETVDTDELRGRSGKRRPRRQSSAWWSRSRTLMACASKPWATDTAFHMRRSTPGSTGSNRNQLTRQSRPSCDRETAEIKRFTSRTVVRHLTYVQSKTVIDRQIVAKILRNYNESLQNLLFTNQLSGCTVIYQQSIIDIIT